MMMTYIELLGPPGVGKSRLYSGLCLDDRHYYGISEDAVSRKIGQILGQKHQKVYSSLPHFIQDPLEQHILKRILYKRSFSEFVTNRPEFVPVLGDIMQSAENPTDIFHLCKSTAEKYQLGHSVCGDDETFCIDEGFLQRAISIQWRKGINRPMEELDTYFETIPIPALLVFIDAPVDICIQRQRKRGKIKNIEGKYSDHHKAIQVHRDYCKSLTKYASSMTDTTVINNEGTRDVGLQKIKSAIEHKIQ